MEGTEFQGKEALFCFAFNRVYHRKFGSKRITIIACPLWIKIGKYKVREAGVVSLRTSLGTKNEGLD